MNYLPMTHAGGIFLIGPTNEFIQYLKDEEFIFESSEVHMDYEVTAWMYLKK